MAYNPKYFTNKDYYKYYHISEKIPGSENKDTHNFFNGQPYSNSVGCCNSCPSCNCDSHNYTASTNPSNHSNSYGGNGNNHTHHYFDYQPCCGSCCCSAPFNNYYI